MKHKCFETFLLANSTEINLIMNPAAQTVTYINRKTDDSTGIKQRSDDGATEYTTGITTE